MGMVAAKSTGTALRALEARLAAIEVERNAQAALSLADLIFASEEEGAGTQHPRSVETARASAKVRAAANDPLAREICRLGECQSDPAAVVRRWRERPVQFARQVFAVVLDPWQAAALEAIAIEPRVAMTAGRGPGKTFLLAIAVLWFLITRAFAKVIAVSLSADNLRRGLIAELAALLRRSASRSTLFSRFDMTGEGLSLSTARLDWFCAFRSWSRDADANTQAAALGGVHGDAMLFVMDEAGGIAPEVLQVAEAVAANANPAQGREAKLLLAGNPLSRTSALYQAAVTNRQRWRVFEISSAPNDPLRAPRVDPAWAQSQIDAYGAESAFVQISIFGRFPSTALNALLSPEEVIEAQRRDVPPEAYAFSARVAGLDPARFGQDATVLTLRQGRKVLLMRTYRGLDNMTLADVVARFIDEEKPDEVFIDAGGGSGVIDRLRQLRYSPIEVPFNAKPSSGRYANKRSEMYVAVQTWVRGGGCLPKEQSELVADLSEPQYEFKGDALAIEPKESIRARIGRSPDWGDSLALTFSQPVWPIMPPSAFAGSLHSSGLTYNPWDRGLGEPHSA